MKQAIAGVTPASVEEATVTVVWPSLARYRLGAWLGRLYGNEAGCYVFTVGNVVALFSVPLVLTLYVWRLARGSVYRLTNRRLMELGNRIQKRERFPYFGIRWGAELKSLALDGFDGIEIVTRPGQEWFEAGDLVFTLGGGEVFRLPGISRPEVFRQTCLKSHRAYVLVRQVLERQAARV